jgi:hypothetical protein
MNSTNIAGILTCISILILAITFILHLFLGHPGEHVFQSKFGERLRAIEVKMEKLEEKR